MRIIVPEDLVFTSSTAAQTSHAVCSSRIKAELLTSSRCLSLLPLLSLPRARTGNFTISQQDHRMAL